MSPNNCSVNDVKRITHCPSLKQAVFCLRDAYSPLMMGRCVLNAKIPMPELIFNVRFRILKIARSLTRFITPIAKNALNAIMTLYW